MPKQVFEIGRWMDDQGITLLGVNESGGYQVRGPDGSEGLLDTDTVLKDLELNPKQFDLEFNNPDQPINESPVSMVDRAKLALGNTKGQLGYLKNKFDDVKVHPDNGLLVKNKGVWQKVDSSGMDAWELTNDLVEGAIGFIPSAVASGVGGAKGAAAGAVAGPVGIVAGSIAGAAGGGGLAEGIRTSLGRLAGTYEAAPEEQLKDVGIEMLLNAGGQAVGLGVKPTLSMLGKAAKNISKTVGLDKLGNATKDVLAGVWGRTTGAGDVATRTLIDQPDEVVGALAKAKNGAGSIADIQTHLRQDQIEAVNEIVDQAPRALTKKFGQLVDDMVEHVDDVESVDLGGVIKRAQQTLVQKGYGKIIAEPQSLALKRGMGIAGDLSQATPEESSKVFQLLSNNEALKKITAGESGVALDDQTRAALKNMAEFTNELALAKSAKGKNAARALMEIKKNVNAMARNVARPDSPPALQSFVKDFKDSVINEIGGEFHRLGVTDKYVATSNLYERFADSVDVARRISQSENGSEVLLNKLIQGTGANQTYKDFAKDMAELLGEAGNQKLKSITVKEAARNFAPILPKSTLGQFTATGLGAGALAAGGVSAPVAGAVAAQTSPRIVMRQVQYMNKALDLLKALPDSQRAQWLRDPNLVRETFKAVLQPAQDEDQNIDQLLQQAGVK